MATKVALYVPNVFGYLRVILSFVGLYVSTTSPVRAVAIWIASALLDLVDGPIARRLDQTSRFGVLLDIAADNVLRACVWIAAASASGDASVQVVAAAVICLEWLTMLSTQLQAHHDAKHWKSASSRVNDHWLFRAMFRNNFRNPIGVLCIFGLFCANLFIYGSHHEVIYQSIPFFGFFRGLALVGRFCASIFEVALCLQYFSSVLEDDSPENQERRG
jgi:CDP-diacylglycerol--inositol 3-phosphatidyltransferase